MRPATSKPDVIDAVAWLEWFRNWRDVIRAPYVVAVAMLAVVTASTGAELGACDASTAAWANGVAAIITAVAALTESRHARAAWVDHEVRLRVIENPGTAGKQ